MGDDDERAAEPVRERRGRLRMPVEDRIPPERWTAEHPDDPDVPDEQPGAADAERVRSTPWGYH